MKYKRFKARRSYRGVRRKRRGILLSRRLLTNVKSYSKYNIHHYKRTCDFSDIGTYDSKTSLGATLAFDNYITLSSAGNNGQVDYYSLALGFSLADLPNYAEFTALYDVYRLDFVVVRLYPICSNSIGITGNANLNPGVLLHYIVDHDDAAAVSSAVSGIDEMRQYDKYKLVNNVQGLKCWKIGIKPKVSMQVFNTAISTAYAEAKGGIYLDANNATVPHFGLKLLFETWNASNNICNWKFRVSNTYYFTCKDVR